MSQYHIGRQPIFDKEMNLFAYELLFRSGDTATANVIDGGQATSQVMVNAFTEIGLDKLVGTQHALINMPYEILSQPELIAFPPQQVILEILEDVTVDKRIIESVALLKSKGYRFALDDFIYSPEWEPLIDMAEIIKIDITQLSAQDLADHVALLKDKGKIVLAERIENQEEFEQLKELDFDYYQGYFFAKPKVISGNRLPASKINLVQLLAKLNAPDVDVEELTQLVSADISLSVKALRFVNSPVTGLKRPINTVHQAVVFLGLDTLKSWMTVLTMTGVDDKPTALIGLALVRAKFCELAGAQLGGGSKDAFFTVGLLSVLDAMLDSDMATVLESLTLCEEVHAALLCRQGVLGEVLEFATRMEAVDATPATLGTLSIEAVAECHYAAMQWADATVTASYQT